MIETKEKTALCTSVGADERQSNQNTIGIIPTSDTEINHQFENSEENLEEMFRHMPRMVSPYYLHTVSMTELYQTSYQSRLPIINGLLYSGAYILAGAPKIGKSFLVAQIAYHISIGTPLWFKCLNFKRENRKDKPTKLQQSIKRVNQQQVSIQAVEQIEAKTLSMTSKFTFDRETTKILSHRHKNM